MRFYHLNFLKFIFIWGVIFFFCIPLAHSRPQVIEYKPLVMAVQLHDRMIIQGFEGRVVLKGGSSRQKEIEVHLKQENPDKPSPEAKAVLDEWLFSLQRKGDVIEAAIRSPQSKSSWNKLLLGGIPQFYLEVSCPSIPLELSWKKGKVVIENWQSTISANLLQGNLSLKGGKGDAVVRVSHGELTVDQREGKIVADSFNAFLQMQKIKGKIEVENFNGKTLLQDMEGNLYVKLTSGSGSLKNIKGHLEFQNLKAPLVIDGFDGEMRGQNGSGSVSAQIMGEADVKIHSKEGSVRLNLTNSGAVVNLATLEGQIFVPSFLSVSRQAHLKSTRGHLRGDKGGHVYVRSTDGSITIK